MRVFTIIGCWILCNVFSASIEMVIWLLSFLLLIWYISGKLLQYSCLENPMEGRSLVGYSPWVREESDMTERLHFHFIYWRSISNINCTTEIIASLRVQSNYWLLSLRYKEFFPPQLMEISLNQPHFFTGFLLGTMTRLVKRLFGACLGRQLEPLDMNKGKGPLRD